MRKLRSFRLDPIYNVAGIALLAFASPITAQAQAPQSVAESAPLPSSESDTAFARRSIAHPIAGDSISLSVPAGTPIQVVLDKELRLRKVGQPLHGHTVEPVYAFDKLVIPVGSEVSGRITNIEPVSTLNRTMDAFDADFTPTRKIDVEFDRIALPDGKNLSIQTTVTPGSGQVIQFVSSADQNQKKGIKDEASDKVKQAKQQARQEWNHAMGKVESPGKVHRIERYAIAQLPVHPQYIEPGTIYFAELRQPLDFGEEPLTPELASSIGSAPSDSAPVHALLVTPLSSAVAQKGDSVQAVISRPLFDNGKLILPEGSFLKGSVVQVAPARRLSHNGQVRFVFHDLVLPDGVEQKIDAVLNGVEAGKADNVKLDAEGGAQATSPKSRYLKTAISMGMAAVSMGGDADAKIANPAGNTSNRVVGGAGGFKLVGMVMGAAVKSRAFGYSMGAYGAGMSVYTHFIARGRDVVFPKNTAMEIAVSTRPDAANTMDSAAPSKAH